MSTVVIVPTYNEQENIEQLIARIFESVPDVGVMVVDDNSPDGTADTVKNLMSRYPNLELFSRAGKEGLGKAYISAFVKVMERSEVETIVMMDADLSHDPAYLPKLLALRSDADVIVGSRYVKGGQTVGWELWRRILSFGGNLYCQLVTGLPIADCTGGFNAISVKYLKKVNFDEMDMSGYAFIMELKYSLYTVGARFKELPIIFRNRTGGESKISSHIVSEGILAPWKMILRQ